MNRAPTFNTPRPTPSPAPAARPSFNPGTTRPAPGPGAGGGNRPSINPPGGGNRPPVTNPPGGGNRPPITNPPGGGNRPPVTNPPGGGNTVVNRPGGGNTVVNRPGGGNTVVNRPGGGNTVVNRPGGNTVVNNNVNNRPTNVNVANRPTTLPANRPGAGYPGYPGYRPPGAGPGGGYWPGRYPYQGYHAGWVHGYWHGYNNAAWNRWPAAAGWGLAAWGVGSLAYGLGSAAFSNPYYAAQPVVVQGAAPAAAAPVYDYSQPINTTAAPPPQDVADPAMKLFDDARAAFHENDYARALTLTDQALTTLPNDATLHEFRALVLFAQGQYDQAAGVLYSVLAVGPGWDWATLIGLYPSIDVYTTQIRALESAVQQRPDAPGPRFVLAYHYLTAGHTDAAVSELKEVTRLQPSDQLSAALVAQLSGAKPGAEAAPGAQPAAAAAAGAAPATEAAPGAEAEAEAAPALPAIPGTAPADLKALTGVWTATPDKERTITLTLRDDARFVWAFTEKGQTQQLEGSASYGNGLLTLAQSEEGATLVGQVALQDNGHLLFRLAGGPPADPGLDFQRAAQQ
jgi:tetratricopeptide (TPR) repeat protein